MVVDDHPMWRDAVERDLADAGLEVVAVAANGREALARFPAARPDVVVLDLQIPPPDGVEVTRSIAEQAPGARVLILSASGEHADVLAAVKAGATGYLVKSASREELLAAVRRVSQGDPVFTPGLAGLVLGEFQRRSEAARDPAGAGGAPPPGGAEAARGGDGGAAHGRQGHVVPPDRRAPRALAPHGAEPRAEHPAQAADAQPRRADPLRHRAGAGRGLSRRTTSAARERPTARVRGSSAHLSK